MGFFDRLFNKQSGSANNTGSAGIASKQQILAFTGKTSGINILEAGASGGEDTLEWAAMPEVGTVFAFEPVEASFQTLQQKVKDNPRIKAFQLALSDKPGETIINISENTRNPDGLPSSSSILTPTGHLEFHRHITFSKQQRVQVVTIDDWAKENDIRTVDVMWLDMQGAEHLALQGALQMLQTTSVIYTEVSLKPMYANSLLYPELKQLLDQLGFRVAQEYLPWEDMGNVLFTRK